MKTLISIALLVSGLNSSVSALETSRLEGFCVARCGRKSYGFVHWTGVKDIRANEAWRRNANVAQFSFGF